MDCSSSSRRRSRGPELRRDAGTQRLIAANADRSLILVLPGREPWGRIGAHDPTNTHSTARSTKLRAPRAVRRTSSSRGSTPRELLRVSLYGRGNNACPICLTGFTRDQASSGRTVTLEHVPIKALGMV